MNTLEGFRARKLEIKDLEAEISKLEKSVKKAKSFSEIQRIRSSIEEAEKARRVKVLEWLG